jgi:sigma-E factor negative regulatory protein RseA
MLNSSGSSSDDAMRQSMSSLMDGRLDGASLDSAFSAWRSDAKARECWHAYHLIGDVLRSDELAAQPSRDEAFLASLRSKLEAEPVPLAPGRHPAGQGERGWRQRLVAPAAVAAGFVAVAGVLVVLRGAAPQEGAGGALVAGGTSGEMMVVNREVIRDARLDRYLAAHRKVSNSASVQVPGAVARSVDTVVLETK